MNPIVLWSDGGDHDHRAELLKTDVGICLRIVRRDGDGSRVSHYVALSPEKREGLAHALTNVAERA